ncbi:MAG: hypothetical protein ACRDGG_11160 [Anaerolineae bacterium]
MSETDSTTSRPKRFPEVPEAFWTHARAARDEAAQAVKHLLPDSFWEHRRTARREALLAVRSLIDAALERTEKKT